MAFDADIERINKYLLSRQAAFDSIMAASRSIIMESGRIITQLHNGDIKNAVKKFGELSSSVEKLKGIDKGFEYYTLQSYQEYAEAAIMLEVKVHDSIPSISKLGVREEAYLFGLMDAVGELKRDVLESLRKGDIEKAESLFAKMNTIYDSTRHIRFAEAILPGFRRKQDTARIQLENAGSEILMFKNASGRLHASQSE
ncbi:MAG: hypothetical protein M1360_03060 [Candidatus Marsarchaeota archaeon]|jgi:translin|nr:hypothetical protein [Candidatus Marsarchaeota archaeon]MCL5418893.1 hypothetical protein [Candidatus Marsarchaeota archaeon]